MSPGVAVVVQALTSAGHGSFGVIRKVKRKADGLILCRKEINYAKMSQKEREQLHAEFQCLSSLRHPNIVAYFHREHLKTQQELHLYMEYCGSGDLGRVIRDLTQKGQRASEPFVWSIFAQLGSALYRCHYGADPPDVGADVFGNTGSQRPPVPSMVIMHRDLKPENVFLGKDNSVKLGDFGLSKMIKSHDFASTYVGTPYYMSPEICAAERYTLKSDIWSLGCIIYELCMREPPFNAKTHFQLVSKIKTGKYPPLPTIYSADLQDAIRDCLKVNSDERPSTFDLLQRPLMRLMRKEKEVSDLNKQLKSREEALALREAELSKRLADMDGQKVSMRQEMDAALRREWEVKAQLEITKHVNAEMQHLQQQFEVEVQLRVEAELKAELKKRRADSSATALSSSESDNPFSSVSGGDGDCPSLTDITDISIDSPEISHVLQKRSTPMRRVQTMFVGNANTPGDIEMSEPSPIAIASLSLSPRRHAAMKGPSAHRENLFRANTVADTSRAAAVADAIWAIPRDPASIESDDEDVIPSPTRQIRSNKNPFASKNRPVLTSHKSTANKALPALPHIGSSPDLGSRAGALRERPPSPNRRLSKIPSAASLVPSTGSGNTNGLTRKLSTKKEEVPLSKVAAKNNIKGRTLVELQQARAGGRPPSAIVAPGVENVSPKRAGPVSFKDRMFGQRRASGEDPLVVAIWDPETEEMPSPFLVRGRQMMNRA
jgi:NIMA (never in mitosis gene a)-related kinase 2